jgi:hypothetical protein
MSKFQAGDRVAYVPLHARLQFDARADYRHPAECLDHPDVEWGIVYRTPANQNTVYVKFDRSVRNCGWEHATAQGCDPADLVKAEEA